MTRSPVTPAAVRRKIESWLSEEDSQTAIALRARAEWAGEPVIAIGDVAVRVVPCPTPIAARAALHDRADGERVALLTELSDMDLGDGLLAHVSRCTVRSVDAWDLVRQMFGLEGLDPTLAESRFGGGRWLADALAEYAPAGGWMPPPGTVLTRDHALRCLTGELLGLDRDQIDAAGLLQWTTDAPALLAFTALPDPVIGGVSTFLVEVVGPASVPIMAAVRAGHGVDAIPLGLLAAALWPSSDAAAGGTGADAHTNAAVARARTERYFGGVRLTAAQAQALHATAEAWVDRELDAGDREQARRMLTRAEALAAEVDATALLTASEVLPAGFTQRLRAFAAAVHRAIPGAPDTVVLAQQVLVALEAHRAAQKARLETARMAVRLLRWLSTEDADGPAHLLDGVHRHVREDGWVDRANLDVFAGDIDAEVEAAYTALHRAVDARRRRHDEQFANLLAAATVAESDPGALIRVEDVLDRLVQPILTHGRRVLLLVMDGMSMPAATELTESLTHTGAWLELTPKGGPRTGVLAALPTVTEVSRCSLLSGRIAVGQAPAERTAFAQRFADGVLLHKGALRAGAGAALDADVRAAIMDTDTPIVAAVVNAIDDALDRSEPGTVVWSEETIHAVRDLLALAQDRVVVLVSDHGHVIDRGPDAVTRRSPTSENRWRPAEPPPGEGEVLVSGSRVALGGGTVVLPWREELRYGPRKAGYHGGAAPAEAVIPLIVLSAGDEEAVPGWAGAPVASPAWWRESARAAPPATAGSRRTPSRQPTQDTTLFDLEPAPSTETTVPPARPPVIDALLASEIYRQRRAMRAPLLDERVAALLGELIAGGGRATLDTLAAGAGVPAHRIGGTVTALRRLLQVEGYPVLELDPDGRTVKLDVSLLAEQFHLDVSDRDVSDRGVSDRDDA